MGLCTRRPFYAARFGLAREQHSGQHPNHGDRSIQARFANGQGNNTDTCFWVHRCGDSREIPLETSRMVFESAFIPVHQLLAPSFCGSKRRPFGV